MLLSPCAELWTENTVHPHAQLVKNLQITSYTVIFRGIIRRTLSVYSPANYSHSNYSLYIYRYACLASLIANFLATWPLHLSLLLFPARWVKCLVTLRPPFAVMILVINGTYLQLWKPGSVNWRLGFTPMKNPYVPVFDLMQLKAL